MTCLENNINSSVCDMNLLEIERKYLVNDSSYKQRAMCKVHIKQGYLSLSPTCTIRVRVWDDKGFITIKSNNQPDSIAHFEWEKELSLDEVAPLFSLCVSGIIEKNRWVVPLDEGLLCEVDEFMGANEGLVLAEVELEASDQLFQRPDFLGDEVTNDERYYNSYLSKHPFTTW